MHNLLFTIDRISTLIGKTFAWLIVALTFLITYEVFSRYVLNSPHPYVFDVMLMMYGTLFMMAGAYTLSKNGHVRGDVLYGFFPPRVQAVLDLTLYIVFFLPGVVALCWAGYDYAADSLAIRERSSIGSGGPPLYLFKSVIPAAGIILLAQGVVEIIRCIICIKQGQWPPRLEDVKEVDVDKLKAMVRTGDEEIAGAGAKAAEEKGSDP